MVFFLFVLFFFFFLGGGLGVFVCQVFVSMDFCLVCGVVGGCSSFWTFILCYGYGLLIFVRCFREGGLFRFSLESVFFWCFPWTFSILFEGKVRSFGRLGLSDLELSLILEVFSGFFGAFAGWN